MSVCLPSHVSRALINTACLCRHAFYAASTSHHLIVYGVSWFVYTTPAPSNLVLAPHHPPAHPHPWYFSTTAALLLLEHYPPRCRPSFLSRLLCRALWFSNTIPPPPACGFLPPASSWFLRTIPDVLACGFVIPQHGLVLQNHSSRPRTWFFYTNTLVVL